MLKLQPSQRGKEIVVRMREKENDSLFWKALLIAIAIHAAGFLFIKIQPFFVISQYKMPPIQVELESIPYIAIADSEDRINMDDIGPPMFSAWQIPLALEKVREEIALLANEGFSQIPASYPKPHIIREYKPLELAVKGELAERKLLSGNLPEDKKASNSRIETSNLIYYVRVDEQNGKIFWFKKISASKNIDHELKAQEIMRNITFDHDAKNIDISGELVFLFRKESA